MCALRALVAAFSPGHDSQCTCATNPLCPPRLVPGPQGQHAPGRVPPAGQVPGPRRALACAAGQWAPEPSLRPVDSGRVFRSVWPDARMASRGAGMQWRAGASLCNPKPRPSLAERWPWGRGRSFPPLSGGPPPDLGHRASASLSAFRKLCSVGFFKYLNASGRNSVLVPFRICTFGFS